MHENNDLRELRLTHFKHERQIYAVAAYLTLPVIIMVPAATITSIMNVGNPEQQGAVLMLMALTVFSVVAQVLLYRGLTRFQTWASILTTVFTAPTLLMFPIGTLMGFLILRALWSKSGKAIFTPEYRRAVAATPDLKTPTSIMLWVALAFGAVGTLLLGAYALQSS